MLIMTMATYIALLRGINVTGHNKIPMADLRMMCTDSGWSEVQSYIQSGNLVFRSDTADEKLEGELEAAILDEFGFQIPVVVRKAEEWREYVKNNPFRAVAEEEPNRLLLTLSKKPPEPGVVEALNERADKGERIAQVGDALYFHYPQGVGKSKLTPALLDRVVGSPVTARNWRTVLKLLDLTEVLRNVFSTGHFGLH